MQPTILAVDMSFDDEFLGTATITNGSFDFILDIPQAQAGVHQIHAFATYPLIQVTANFTVLPEPGKLSIIISTGTIYFPGETATAYVRVALNGNLTTPATLNLRLILPNGSSIRPSPISLGVGFYQAQFSIPITAQLGTYVFVGNVTSNGLTASGLASFEVKLSWLSSHGTQLGLLAAGIGTITITGVALKGGYLSRRRDPEHAQSPTVAQENHP